jgi:hypothetical protein
MEIVAKEPALMYDTEEEAAEKILRTMSDPVEQARLTALLAATSERFSTGHFVRQVRAIVDEFEA